MPIMPFKNLQSVIREFEKGGQLIKIKEPLNPKLEMTEVTDRVVKKGGPALLFENPTGYDIPVLTNLYGSLDRIRSIFNIRELDDLGARFLRFLEMAPPKGWIEKLKLLPVLKEIAHVFPKTVKNAPCQEVVNTDAPDLTRLPVLTCWPHDGGPFITLPLVITRHPTTGKQNMGMYRIQIYDGRTAGMHWHIHKDGSAQYREASPESLFPVAVAIGADPVTTYCATAPPAGRNRRTDPFRVFEEQTGRSRQMHYV